MALAGKTILITRAAHQAGEVSTSVRQRGGVPLMFPTIDIVPPASWEACDRAIEKLSGTDALLFTSANAVEFFLRRLEERGHSPSELGSKMLCAVGRATREAIETRGLRVAVMPQTFTSSDLAKILKRDDVRGLSFLFPCGNLAHNELPETLRRLGAEVEPVVVYRTVRPPESEVGRIRAMLLAGSVDVLTFTSPSTWRNFIGLFPGEDVRSAIRSAAVAAIGPVTAREIEASGFRVDLVAAESTVESLVGSIENFFENPSHDQ